ncbi:MAG: hypothetical protein H6741_06180 [Alphaproteobacteria bacterium]|nr:hypothetical protein [Alphaproteobacteria bacterium]MCB9792297.1 hypothetical protein [Alphaproteobacteria bacterium]
MKRLLLALASLLLSLLAVEAGVRLLAPQPPLTPPSQPLLRGPLTQPGVHEVRTAEFSAQVHVNAQGFVDAEWGPRREGVPRVVVIGDSFVQAAQVNLEQGFGRQLQRALSAQLGGPVEVLSLGVPGAGTATALGLLEQYALDLQPDLVVLGFLVSNDVLNNHPLLEGKDDKPFYALEQGQLVPIDAAGAAAPGWTRGLLVEHSQAWRWASRAVANSLAVRRKLALGGGIPLDLRVHDPDPDPVWEQAWAVTEALISALSERCEADGVGFVVLLFPDRVQATEAGARDAVAAWPQAQGWDFSAAQARAARIAAPHADAVLDLTPALSAAQRGPPLYFAQDGHWTARGHAVAAEAAAPTIARELRPRP